jgi:hypothetical protein
MRWERTHADPFLSPPRKLRLESASPRPSKGALSRGVAKAGRGAAPAGSVTQTRHSGGIGAPPGATTSPCQELADDLGFALPAFGLVERDALTGKRGPMPKDAANRHALF